MTRAAVLCALCALALVPAANADHTRDIWEGTWRASGLGSRLVLKPATDARTRAQAPPCSGGRTLYSGAYTGSRNGTVAACAQRYSLTGRLYEGGRRVGNFGATWALEVAPDLVTLGRPTFSGTTTFGRVSGTWLRHGGTLPKTGTTPSTGTAKAAVAKVEAILRRNAVRCEMTWSKIVARKTANGFRVTATVRTFGNAGSAIWNVIGARVAAADPLAADIENGCP